MNPQRHARESGHPDLPPVLGLWIPAFAGMTLIDAPYTRSDNSDVHTSLNCAWPMTSCRRRSGPRRRWAWPLLARRLGTEVVVKHENHNPTGAFKVRGGLTFVDALRRRKPHSKGLVSATRGNHGQSLAFAAGGAGLPVTIYVPRGNSVEKNAAMRALGAELVEHGDDFQAAREEAIRVSQSGGLDLVPAFHSRSRSRRRDLRAGTLRRSPRSRRSLCSGRPGVGHLRVASPRAMRSASAQRSSASNPPRPRPMPLSLAAGRVVRTDSADTLADGMATRVPDEEALAVIRRGVARFVLVTDAEIAGCDSRLLEDRHAQSGRGAPGRRRSPRPSRRKIGWPEKKVGLVLSGGNIDFDLFKSWVVGPREDRQ